MNRLHDFPRKFALAVLTRLVVNANTVLAAPIQPTRSTSSTNAENGSTDTPREILLEICLILSLIINATCYSIECWYTYHPDTNEPRRCKLRYYGWIPTGFWMLLLPVQYIKPHETRGCPTENLNPDIGGPGTRFGIHAANAMTLIAMFLGHFHTKATGAKELCGVLVVTLSYFTLNLLKSQGSSEVLNFPEVMVACILIDGMSAAVSMTLSSKDTLAARQLVRVSSLVQFIAHVTIWIMVAKIPHEEPSSNRCCYQVAWWGMINSCTGATRSVHVYFGFRFIAWLHNAWLGLHYMHVYDQAEKSDRKDSMEPNSDQSNGQAETLLTTIRNRFWRESDRKESRTKSNSNKSTDQTGALFTTLWNWVKWLWRLLFENELCNIRLGTYGEEPATTFSKYGEWIVTFIVATISIEKFLRLDDFKNFGKLRDWGQSAALITGIFGALRVVYLALLVINRKEWNAPKDWASIDKARIDGVDKWGKEVKTAAKTDAETEVIGKVSPKKDPDEGHTTSYKPPGGDPRLRRPKNKLVEEQQLAELARRDAAYERERRLRALERREELAEEARRDAAREREELRRRRLRALERVSEPNQR